MTARFELGRPDFDPADKPAVRLTETGRAFGSALLFPNELEEYLPTFFEGIRKKMEEAAAKRKNLTEDWFSVDTLLAVMEELYASIATCKFSPTVEAGIRKVAERILKGDDQGKELTKDEIERMASFVSWVLLAGITLERKRKLNLSEVVKKIVGS